jgi:hypothetical protein
VEEVEEQEEQEIMPLPFLAGLGGPDLHVALREHKNTTLAAAAVATIARRDWFPEELEAEEAEREMEIRGHRKMDKPTPEEVGVEFETPLGPAEPEAAEL